MFLTEIKPFVSDWSVRMSPELTELLRKAREQVDAMSPEERADMLRKQVEGWARSEAQWAKDFREGKCKYD